MGELKVGDRVEALKDMGEYLKGEQGTIVGLNRAQVAIRFDCYDLSRGIYKIGECEPGYGHWATLCEFGIGVLVVIPKSKFGKIKVVSRKKKNNLLA